MVVPLPVVVVVALALALALVVVVVVGDDVVPVPVAVGVVVDGRMTGTLLRHSGASGNGIAVVAAVVPVPVPAEAVTVVAEGMRRSFSNRLAAHSPSCGGCTVAAVMLSGVPRLGGDARPWPGSRENKLLVLVLSEEEAEEEGGRGGGGGVGATDGKDRGGSVSDVGSVAAADGAKGVMETAEDSDRDEGLIIEKKSDRGRCAKIV